MWGQRALDEDPDNFRHQELVKAMQGKIAASSEPGFAALDIRFYLFDQTIYDVWAAAMTSLKMESDGPFHRGIAEVEDLLQREYGLVPGGPPVPAPLPTGNTAGA